ncbi:hypothetical protein ABZY42_21795 [Streptomyces sp. NPDC006622]|uniref:hypothetical protein n=1 Tax=Streptomyces sp. NPDC006622 TaxID=3155459 RepID=UPI0033A977C1
MSHLLFVETTGLGVEALAHAKRSGHTVAYLHCPLYDFTATPAQRGQAVQLADHAAPFTDPLDGDAVYAALLASGADPAGVDGGFPLLAERTRTPAPAG